MSASTQQVSEWLSDLGTALDRADFDAAVQMFEEDSYWRDLLSLTWNIKTLEGKENIKAMLEATVPDAKPGQWRIEGDATIPTPGSIGPTPESQEGVLPSGKPQQQISER
jgi:putative flavoprotein involved in K+ transport